jgi:hypothetical protein
LILTPARAYSPPALLFRISVVVATVVLAEPSIPWTLDRTVDGLQVAYREVPDSPFHEYRITTRSRLPLERLCDAVWGKNAKVTGDFKKRVIIRESDHERWTYEQVGVPMVTDRDCVMHVQLLQPAPTGRCVVKFETGEDPKFPPDPNFVRVPVVRGSWQLEPMRDGGTAVTYTVYSEPGGAVPALFARGGQRDAAIGFMKTILERASQ